MGFQKPNIIFQFTEGGVECFFMFDNFVLGKISTCEGRDFFIFSISRNNGHFEEQCAASAIWFWFFGQLCVSGAFDHKILKTSRPSTCEGSSSPFGMTQSSGLLWNRVEFTQPFLGSSILLASSLGCSFAAEYPAG
jgi:hypothetical protein